MGGGARNGCPLAVAKRSRRGAYAAKVRPGWARRWRARRMARSGSRAIKSTIAQLTQAGSNPALGNNLVVNPGGPAAHGTNLFCGWIDLSDLCQDIDVSAAPPAIDAGQVTYVASGWIGGSNTSASITYLFFDWSNNQLAPTAQLTSPLLPNYALTEVEHSGTLPAKTRRVRIEIDFPASDSLAGDIGFTLFAPSAAPVLTPAS